MAWTKKQKTMAAMACRTAGVSDEHRKLILRQFDNAMYDAKGARREEPSSTSRRLTNGDFEQFMAIIERQAGGQLKAGRQTYSKHYWRNKADDVCQRMRDLVDRLADALECNGKLEPGGVGLDGWIRKYVVGDDDCAMNFSVAHSGLLTPADLDYQALHKLINGLRSYARRNGVEWEPSEPREPVESAAVQTPVEGDSIPI